MQDKPRKLAVDSLRDDGWHEPWLLMKVRRAASREELEAIGRSIKDLDPQCKEWLDVLRQAFSERWEQLDA